jgi:hypothetical protein
MPIEGIIRQMFSVLTLLDILDSCVREAMSLYNKSTDDRAQSIPRADIDAAVALAPAAHAAAVENQAIAALVAPHAMA